MKAVILAGGLGTRFREETHIKPKPMIEIGGKPILWHIMKIFSTYEINEFIICCGYKGYVIKEYFANYFLHNSDVTFHLDMDNKMEIHRRKNEPWKVTLIDTGELTQTGGRLARIKSFLDENSFCFTYGDGVSDINIKNLIDFHKSQNCSATLTAVQPPGRFGALRLDGFNVNQFEEKADGDNSWVNGGFFVLEPHVIDLIADDSTSWESEVLPQIALKRDLCAYKHQGFWHSMDTLRDQKQLEKMWFNGSAPWKSW